MYAHSCAEQTAQNRTMKKAKCHMTVTRDQQSTARNRMMMMMMDELLSCHKVQGTARTRNSKMCHAVMSEQWKRL